MPDIMDSLSDVKGIEGNRAAFAYECVAEVKKNPKNYSSYVKKMPAQIKSNGLGQTLGFMFSKKKTGSKPDNEYDHLLRQLRQYLIFCELLPREINNSEKFLESIVKMEAFDYRYATTEVLSLLNWLRRFAEGLLGGD